MFETSTTRSNVIPQGLAEIEMISPDVAEDLPYYKTPYFMISPAWQNYYEKVTPSIKGSSKIWKSFEHYKRSSATDSSSFGSALMTRSPLYTNYMAMIGYPQGAHLLYGAGFGAPGELSDGLPAIANTALDAGFVHAPSSINSLISASLQTMLPLIRPELSGVNSVIELKDFKTLPRSISAISKLPKLLLRKKKALVNIAHLLQVAADVYLQTKFNIQPLISDVHGIHRALAKTEKRINALVSRSGKMQTSHYKKFVNEYDAVYEQTLLNQPAPYHYSYNGGGALGFYSRCDVRRLAYYSPSSFHAQIQYNYYYTEYQIEHARLLALLDAFGVNFNPAIIWNAIPWSFVVDWLVGVSQWLGTQRIGLMDPKINIMQYLWSIKRQRRIYVTSKYTSPKYYAGTGLTDTYGPQSITHPVVDETAYRRSAGLPSASSIILSGLSSTEFTLGAALAITSRRHKRKH